MPDPIWKVIQRYNDETTQLGWSLSSFIQAATPPGAETVPFANWVDAYAAVRAESTKLVDVRISSVGTFRDEYIINGFEMSGCIGQVAGVATEIASYAQLRGQGGRILQGSSAWKLHGISATMVNGSVLNIIGDPRDALLATALIWFKLYRPHVKAGSSMPVVATPSSFISFAATGMYNRRLGRPFMSPGQQRRYTRTAPELP